MTKPRTYTAPHALWNVRLLVSDMTVKGWSVRELSRRSGLAHRTITNFLDGETQTAKTATKLAATLGYSVRRYLAKVSAA
jgi:lambda repressor-like predicted transcriptional regulator